MKYRSEIDGLRAVAVVPVILFHAGFSQFSGGYLGVDVFFVISGYLISSILINDLERGKYSIVDFYERRARRILPALFFVIIACIPPAILWLSPGDLEQFSRNLLGVLSFSVNFQFAADSGYFADNSELNPLLHTWSLAVEEQFYIFFPLLLALIWPKGKRLTAVVLAGLFVASLGLAEWGVRLYPQQSFFLLPTRVWELLVGVFCALYLHGNASSNSLNGPRKLLSELASGLGLLLILVAVFSLDAESPIPGVLGLVPTLGTALIILFATPGTTVHRLLSIKILVGIGLVSYSAYLWHQPLYAFLRYHFHALHHPLMLLGVMGLTFLLAYISWRFVEQPFRNKGVISRQKIFTGSALATLVFAAIAVTGLMLKGLPQRYSDAVSNILAYQEYPYSRNYREGLCFLKPHQKHHDFAEQCERAKGGLMWGDSHAAALFPGLDKHWQMTKFTASMCPPLIDFDAPRRVYCRDINSHVLDKIAQHQYPIVILHANWGFYEQDTMIERLNSTLHEIKRVSPESEIMLVGGVVDWGEAGLPTLLAEQIVAEREFVSKDIHLAVDVDQVLALDAEILAVAAAHQDVEFIAPTDYLCEQSSCLAAIREQGSYTPIAWDYGHLTGRGAQFLAARIVADSSLQETGY